MSAPHRLLYLIHLERLCTLAQCPLHRCLTLSVNMHDQLHFSTLNLAGTHSRILKKKKKEKKRKCDFSGLYFSSFICLLLLLISVSALILSQSFSLPAILVFLLRSSASLLQYWCMMQWNKAWASTFSSNFIPPQTCLPSFLHFVYLPLSSSFFSFFPFYFHVACPPHRFLLLSSSLLFLLSPLQSALLSVCFINKIYLL